MAAISPFIAHHTAVHGSTYMSHRSDGDLTCSFLDRRLLLPLSHPRTPTNCTALHCTMKPLSASWQIYTDKLRGRGKSSKMIEYSITFTCGLG